MKTIRFKSFSSGSCGNCYFLGIFDDKRCECGILIDSGVSPRRVVKELGSDGLSPDVIGGILITHDHFDHIRSLGSFCKHLGKPVWATPCLLKALVGRVITVEHLSPLRRPLSEGWNDIVPGRIRARYFEVPHDATQTVGYAILLDGFKFLIMTDAGRVTKEASGLAKMADCVVIESNYDPDMLLRSSYPKDLQDRIRDGHGHLSNEECAQAIKEFAHEGLRSVFLCHRSEHNNTPQLAFDCSRRVLDPSVRLAVLPRMTASPLFEFEMIEDCQVIF